MSKRFAFISAMGGIGVTLAILATSCLSVELSPPTVFTPTSVLPENDSNRNTITIPTPTPKATPTSLARVTVELGTSARFTPPPISTETHSNSRATVISTPSFELTPPPTASVEPEAQLITLINQERTTRGLSALVANPHLMAAAQAHSQDMAHHHFFDHVGSDGSTPGDRITREGYAWTFFAENLGCGYPTSEALVQAWLNSPGHRANMLAPEAEHIGVGVAYSPDTDCIYYSTSLFARVSEVSLGHS